MAVLKAHEQPKFVGLRRWLHDKIRIHQFRVTAGTERYRDKWTEIADLHCIFCPVEAKGAKPSNF